MISFGWIGVGLPCREGIKTDWIAQSISARMGIELKKEAIGKRNQIEARQNDPAHVSVCPAVFRFARSNTAPSPAIYSLFSAYPDQAKLPSFAQTTTLGTI